MKNTASAAFERPICALGRFRRIDRNGQPRERRLLLGLFLGAVFVEAVGAQPRAEGQLCRGVGGGGGRPSATSTATVASVSPAPFRCAASAPPSSSKSRASARSGLPSPASTIRLSGNFAGATIGNSSPFLPLNRAAAASARAIVALGCLVEPAGGRRQRTVFPDPGDGGAGTGQVRLGKGCFHYATSSWRRERCRLRPRQRVSLGDRYINRPGLHQGSPRRNVAAPGQGWPQLLPMPLSQSDGGT